MVRKRSPVPVAGTCSHMCGVGLAVILVGPFLTVLLASVTLTFQALFMTHGGFTTLGANIVSMGVVGSFAGYGAFRLARWMNLPLAASAFLAGLICDWATYTMTSFELASALVGGQSFLTLLCMFMPVQIPLGLLEGFLTAAAVKFMVSRRPELLREGVS